MSANAEGAAQFKAMLKHEGIPLSAVKERPHNWNMRDLIEKRVDAMTAYSTVEPTQLRQAGVEPAIIRVADYGVDFYGDTLFTTEAVVKKDRARVAAFIRATRKGWEYAMEHQAEMIDLILKKPDVQERGLQRENLEFEAREMRTLILPDLVDIGHMNLGRWERMEQIFQETGLIRHKPSLQRFSVRPEPPPDRRLLWVARWRPRRGLARSAASRCSGPFNCGKKVEKSTREVRLSEANLTALIENTSAAIWSVDRELPLHHLQFPLSRAWSRSASGVTPAVGMKLDDLLPRRAAGRAQAALRAGAGWRTFHPRSDPQLSGAGCARWRNRSTPSPAAARSPA